MRVMKIDNVWHELPDHCDWAITLPNDESVVVTKQNGKVVVYRMDGTAIVVPEGKSIESVVIEND